MHTLIAKLLGRSDVDSIDRVHWSFGAEWAARGPAWVLFGCLGLGFLAAFFYLRYQPRAKRSQRMVLGFLRGFALCFLLLILADPILEVSFSSHPRPALWVLLDGTDSMNIADQLTPELKEKIEKAVDLEALKTPDAATTETSKDPKPDAVSITRADLVRGWLKQDKAGLLKSLSEKFDINVFQFGNSEDVQSLTLAPGDSTDKKLVDPAHIAKQLTPTGQTTSLSGAFEDLRRRPVANLAGVLVVSDFDHNSGVAPLETARKLGVPIFALGVGATHAVDIAVDLQTSLKMKKTESSTVTVTLRQQELEGQNVTVRVFAQPIEAGSDAVDQAKQINVGERAVTLTGPSTLLEFPFTPQEAGRFVFSAEVEALPGEIVEQNNRATREVTVIDDFLRLLFVEYEPTWEWRFVKEVFHRDKLVGLRGFRTYLRSSDPVVRETNELFLPTVTLPRNQFFEHDVLFLGDMPASALSTRFGEMAKEFVGKFGGGLVVMAGPRFGPGELAGTPIADMLPVVVDPDGRPRDSREFEFRLSPMASQYDFMRLGQSDAENARAWANLGQLPWYQPVKRVEASSTTVLAEHPTDTCVDGKTPQPLIAIRKFGRGEVVYIAHNEMWRLRRRYGELYYRQFWGQLIHRLGLSHALGSQKRFVVRTDRQQYQPDEQVLVTVEAFDENFEPLTGEALQDRHLTGDLWLPGRSTQSLDRTRSLSLTEYRPGIFETRIPVSDAGDYVVRVNDPVTKEPVDVYFQVQNLSIERRSATRNLSLQQNIAAETNGRSCELDNVSEVFASFTPPRLTETSVEVFPLWSTWLTFVVLIGLLLAEWTLRKLSNLV